jgi:hypothetical protein
MINEGGVLMTRDKAPSFPEPEIPIVGGVPIPPNVRPVIIVQGSDYEMGYQYYQQVVQIYGKWIATHHRLVGPNQGGPWLAGPWIFKEIKHTEYSKGNLAALKQWEKLFKKYTPEMIDMYKGMADGATDAGVPLSYLDFLAHFTGYPYSMSGSGSEIAEADKCSGFAAWGRTTTDGKLVCGGNGDDQENYFSTTIIAFPKTGNNFVYSPFNIIGFGWYPCHPGMNNKGLVHVHHGGGTRGNETSGDHIGIPTGVATLHTLRFADNADEALKMQLAYPRGIKAGGLWADVTGNAFVIECRDPEAVRRSGYNHETDFIFATNNRICKELGAPGEEYVPHAGWLAATPFNISAIPRNLGMWNMLHYYQGKVDFDFAKMMYHFPGNPPDSPTMEEASAAYYETKGKGWDQKICNLLNSVVGIASPDNGNEGLYYISTGCAARVAHPHFAFPDGVSYTPGSTYAFYQLKLAASPEQVVLAARAQAQYDLYYTNLELKNLNYKTNGYAALDALFNNALTEWFTGEFHFSPVVSRVTAGNESVYKCARSLRAFTRCQALSKQVYEALLPPATCPEDLGLKPYKHWEEKTRKS